MTLRNVIIAALLCIASFTSGMIEGYNSDIPKNPPPPTPLHPDYQIVIESDSTLSIYDSTRKVGVITDKDTTLFNMLYEDNK